LEQQSSFPVMGFAFISVS